MAAEMTLELIKDIISTDLSNHDKLNAIEDILMDDNREGAVKMTAENKLEGIMGVCNRWTQYHKSLRAQWKTMTYDDMTDMLVNPIISIIQGLSTTVRNEE